MNLDKVISGFFIILAMTINFGFFYGDMHSLDAHSKYELFAAIIINVIATTEFLIISTVPSNGELKKCRPITSTKMIPAINRTQKAEMT